ncbi:MAG: hypothetical protein ACKOBO_03740 [Acidimicrobiales bacterium]
MMRRLFWFVLGALSGIAAYVKVKSMLGEAREAMTLRNVAAAVRALLGALWSAVRGYVVDRMGPDATGGVDTRPGAATGPARRHISTRQSSHHG